MATKLFLYAGTASAVVFWVGNLIAGYLHGNYSFLNDSVSELGALGTQSHDFMTVVMYLSGTLGVLFTTGAFKACRMLGINPIPAITCISIPFTTLWAGYFPSGNPMHAATGPVFLITYIGVILSLFLWRGEKLKTLRVWSFISLLLLMGIFFKFFPQVFGGHEGLFQRFAHLGWSVWFVAINFCFIKLLNSKSTKKIKA
jgi:hypothetical membrane protein